MLPALSKLSIGVEVDSECEDELVAVPGALEIASADAAVWAEWGSSAFAVRTTYFPGSVFKDGNTRAKCQYGIDEYNKFSVHKGSLLVSTLHKGAQTRVLNAYFFENCDEEPHILDDLAELMAGHLSRSGKENQAIRRKTIAQNKKGLVSQVLGAAVAAHEPSKKLEFPTMNEQLRWFGSITCTNDNLDWPYDREQSPLETLQFASLLRPIRVETNEEVEFYTEEQIAQAWIKQKNSPEWSEYDMIDFFVSGGKMMPTFGYFFRNIRKTLYKIATARVSYSEEQEADAQARGTKDNGWTWTMHSSAAAYYKEVFENEKRWREREKEERRLHKEARARTSFSVPL